MITVKQVLKWCRKRPKLTLDEINRKRSWENTVSQINNFMKENYEANKDYFKKLFEKQKQEKLFEPGDKIKIAGHSAMILQVIDGEYAYVEFKDGEKGFIKFTEIK